MYHSTRGWSQETTAAQAIIAGIAPDGGLYVPAHMPKIDELFIQSLAKLDYPERAKAIMALFLPDFTELELDACVSNAYGAAKFSTTAIAPVKLIEEGPALLELWHGPTAAFKDMALQLLPQLLSVALAKTDHDDKIAILVATSGDTGKAALEGFRDVKRTEIIVFYPLDGVSQVQRLQMVTQEGENVSVVAVQGNFDDAQTGVKTIFADSVLSANLADQGIRLSSANSINWGRLLPQIVYYFSAYADMVQSGRVAIGKPVNFAVPTGNFGNILAGYYAKQMGLPIGRLICASNQNNVLTEFITSGVYDRNRPFHKTLSPSMDILVSSNLERLLYHLSGGNTVKVSGWQSELNATGRYQVDNAVRQAVSSLFWADWSDDVTTKNTIKTVYEQWQYLLDPHTAVAWHAFERYSQVTGDTNPCVIVSTASPFKFCDSVLEALEGKPQSDANQGLELLDRLSSLTGLPIPAALAALANKPIRHYQTCQKGEMGSLVERTLIG
ncbi:threonine synthase [Anaerosporomusa subterranea]|uniref:Threonine synthase n=1 Tax=Anaerosporomusa subterranea TaxID=1794912 RepID=A0A154BME7_ANASB|nr:threonine synthase [Anaerosporomusa subterranea]KYZ75096.1 threonine synthase [Anaerosporomusa subterranea]